MVRSGLALLGPGLATSLVSLEVEVPLSAICKFLHQSGLTRQKMITTASKRDELLREQFISDVSVYNPDMLVFIDETCRQEKPT